MKYYVNNKLDLNAQQIIYIYSGLEFGATFILLIRTIFMTQAGFWTSKKSFSEQINALLRAPVNLYYDIVPLGRILNRLSKDQSDIDLRIQFMFGSIFANFFSILGTLSICFLSIPQATASAPFIIILMYIMKRYYIASAREIQRIESISNSPIISYHSEILSGQTVIRAFNNTGKIKAYFKQLLKVNLQAYFLQQALIVWLNFYLSLISFVLFTCCLVLMISMRNQIETGTVGLIIAYLLPFSSNLQNFITNIGQLESKMISVERCHQLTKIQPERIVANPEEQNMSHWPKYGQITFNKIKMRYRPETPLVLNDLSFYINPLEKIGIAGRTGSGKSSIAVALFRIVELEAGYILIDGVDISQLSLNFLRSKLCIIPQDPVLFIGTLRFNIDPLQQKTDQEMIQVLKEIQLYNKFVTDEGGYDVLEKNIQEGGSNLSVGERQLLCIARAILRPSKVLIMDEATASVDFKTDQIIQKLIQEKFIDRTVLTIAHRAKSIKNCDRILVLKKGTMQYFDSFENLSKKGKNFMKHFKEDQQIQL